MQRGIDTEVPGLTTHADSETSRLLDHIVDKEAFKTLFEIRGPWQKDITEWMESVCHQDFDKMFAFITSEIQNLYRAGDQEAVERVKNHKSWTSIDGLREREHLDNSPESENRTETGLRHIR